jgi:hypothetical protein
MSADLLRWLEEWYTSQCDGEWEHRYGIKIDTLDNPGWSIEISLVGTVSADRTQVAGKQFTSEHNWLVYEVKDSIFRGSCGPRNLSDLVEIFRAAVDKS